MSFGLVGPVVGLGLMSAEGGVETEVTLDSDSLSVCSGISVYAVEDRLDWVRAWPKCITGAAPRDADSAVGAMEREMAAGDWRRGANGSASSESAGAGADWIREKNGLVRGIEWDDMCALARRGMPLGGVRWAGAWYCASVTRRLVQWSVCGGMCGAGWATDGMCSL